MPPDSFTDLRKREDAASLGDITGNGFSHDDLSVARHRHAESPIKKLHAAEQGPTGSIECSATACHSLASPLPVGGRVLSGSSARMSLIAPHGSRSRDRMTRRRSQRCRYRGRSLLGRLIFVPVRKGRFEPPRDERREDRHQTICSTRSPDGCYIRAIVANHRAHEDRLTIGAGVSPHRAGGVQRN